MSHSSLSELKTLTEFNSLLKHYQVVIVDAWRPDCEPCKYLTPKLEQVQEILNNPNLIVVTENVDVRIHRPDGYPSVYFYIRGDKKPFHVTLGSDYPEIVRTIAEIYAEMKYPLTDSQKEQLKAINSNSESQRGSLKSNTTSSKGNSKDAAALPSTRRGSNRSNYATYGDLGNGK